MSAKRSDLCKLIMLTLENALSEATGLDEITDASTLNRKLHTLKEDLRRAQEYLNTAGRTFTKDEIEEIVNYNLEVSISRRNRHLKNLLENE